MKDKGCVFCDIASGKIKSYKVYEDDKVIAFFDINPVNPCHILVIPKKHYEVITNMPVSTAKHIMSVLVKLSYALKRAIDPAGINILQANGEAAGQDVFHVHFHLIPRFHGDKQNIDFIWNPQKINDKEMKRLQSLMKKKMKA